MNRPRQSSNPCPPLYPHSGTTIDEFDPVRHPDLSFDDGNIAIRTGRYYFLVHRGLLCHHAKFFSDIAQSLEGHDSLLEGRAILNLQDSPNDMLQFLRALYDGISALRYNANDFCQVSSILRLATKYHATRLRETVIEQLSASWPQTLQMWEQRERLATDACGLYAPRPTLPHPIPLIKLAREIYAPQLLPSAFYDLCRYTPSQVVMGYTSTDGVHHQLSNDDILVTFKGRESAARFLSSFIVSDIENREASEWCVHRSEACPDKRRTCRIAFEAVTFELLRDVNGLLFNRNSDPLYAIAESHGMQTRVDFAGADNRTFKACEACKQDLALVVNTTRQHFWRNLPTWFQVDLPEWGAP